jgi:hypothetical protein
MLSTEMPSPEFVARARVIQDRHRAQTLDEALALAEKYRQPIMSWPLRPIDLLVMLERCVDPTDKKLYEVNQLTHTLQVVEAMEADKADDEMIFVGLVHDLGKILLLTDEDPANVVCPTWVLGSPSPGIGLLNCVLTFNHDEFGFMRLCRHVSARAAWLIRHHSLSDDPMRPGDPAASHMRYFNKSDRDLLPDLERLRRWDGETKSQEHQPANRLEQYASLLLRFLPKRIIF